MPPNSRRCRDRGERARGRQRGAAPTTSRVTLSFVEAGLPRSAARERRPPSGGWGDGVDYFRTLEPSDQGQRDAFAAHSYRAAANLTLVIHDRDAHATSSTLAAHTLPERVVILLLRRRRLLPLHRAGLWLVPGRGHVQRERPPARGPRRDTARQGARRDRRPLSTPILARGKLNAPTCWPHRTVRRRAARLGARCGLPSAHPERLRRLRRAVG